MFSLRTFNLTLLVAMGLALALTATFNYLVNPFDIFAVKTLSGINAIKHEAGRRERLSKAYQIGRFKPDALILGTSQALRLDPHHHFFTGTRAYNGAIASASMMESLAYLKHAHAAGGVRTVVLGLDIFSGGGGSQPGFVPDRLLDAGDNTRNRWSSFKVHVHDRISSLLSIDALRASVKTVANQYRRDSNRLPLDFRRNRVPSSGGQRKMFVDAERVYFDDASFLPVRPSKLRRTPGLGPSDFAYLEKLLEFCYLNGIRAVLFVSPGHARLLEVWHALGYGTHMEQWRQQLVATVEAVADRSGGKPFPIIDFSGYNKVTTEPVPLPGDTTTVMRWHEESTHYSIETAGLILDRLTLPVDQACASGDCFGIYLNSGNVRNHNLRLRELRRHWRFRAPADVNDIENLAIQAMQRGSPAFLINKDIKDIQEAR